MIRIKNLFHSYVVKNWIGKDVDCMKNDKLNKILVYKAIHFCYEVWVE